MDRVRLVSLTPYRRTDLRAERAGQKSGSYEDRETEAMRSHFHHFAIVYTFSDISDVNAGGVLVNLRRMASLASSISAMFVADAMT